MDKTTAAKRPAQPHTNTFTFTDAEALYLFYEHWRNLYLEERERQHEAEKAKIIEQSGAMMAAAMRAAQAAQPPAAPGETPAPGADSKDGAGADAEKITGATANQQAGAAAGNDGGGGLGAGAAGAEAVKKAKGGRPTATQYPVTQAEVAEWAELSIPTVARYDKAFEAGKQINGYPGRENEAAIRRWCIKRKAHIAEKSEKRRKANGVDLAPGAGFIIHKNPTGPIR